MTATFRPVWDPSFIIAVAILGSIAGIALLAAAGALGFHLAGRDTYDGGLWLGLVAALVFLFTAALFVPITWPPFAAQYHRYVPKSGTVAAVTSRFLGDGSGGTQQKFAVRFTTGQVVGCEDTRCSQVREGDRLTLMCERAWQWAGVPGWDCNWGRDWTRRF